jgi:hypothetical protein
MFDKEVPCPKGGSIAKARSGGLESARLISDECAVCRLSAYRHALHHGGRTYDHGRVHDPREAVEVLEVFRGPLRALNAQEAARLAHLLVRGARRGRR